MKAGEPTQPSTNKGHEYSNNTRWASSRIRVFVKNSWTADHRLFSNRTLSHQDLKVLVKFLDSEYIIGLSLRSQRTLLAEAIPQPGWRLPRQAKIALLAVTANFNKALLKCPF